MSLPGTLFAAGCLHFPEDGARHDVDDLRLVVEPGRDPISQKRNELFSHLRLPKPDLSGPQGILAHTVSRTLATEYRPALYTL